MEQARAHWMTVGKPLFSLGKLEDAVIRMAGIKRSADYTLEKKALVILCADNGIVAEGVTQTGQEVTAIVAENFTKGAASTNIMAEVAGVDIFPVDIGMATDVSGLTVGEKKVARGTKNFAKEPAMSRQEVYLNRLRGTGERLWSDRNRRDGNREYDDKQRRGVCSAWKRSGGSDRERRRADERGT